MKANRLSVAGLFAGIGGIELGLHEAGFHTELLCEIDAGAQRVLTAHFDAELVDDVRRLKLPKVDIVAAGFPCQDLSQAGRTAGIQGTQSGLVSEVLVRLSDKKNGPRWLFLENVPFMLQLQRGKAMRYLVDELEARGFTWAYRVVDTRAFGLPQRRQRVLLLASRSDDPRPILFGQDAEDTVKEFDGDQLCGFYWTEGSRGLGWAIDAVPTLKGGSSIGIPSPPGVWDPTNHGITTPDIRDAERLQGFRPDWTLPAVCDGSVRKGHRWKLVGNAVSVPVARWAGERILNATGSAPMGRPLKPGAPWPRAAWGHAGSVNAVEVSTWPVRNKQPSLRGFFQFERQPLSLRATAGFYGRAIVSGLRFEAGFLEDVKRHVDRMGRTVAA
jgi:DNA (cytosine-5)-methyltransferase 1